MVGVVDVLCFRLRTGDGLWNIFTQFHHTGSSGQSNIEFTVKDNSTLVLISNSGDPLSLRSTTTVLRRSPEVVGTTSCSTSSGRRTQASASSRHT